MKISVVIPTYNEEKGLERFLRQFNKQTMPRDEFEIIIVDGNSTDRTRQIAEKYADVVLIQKSKGVGGARNDGVAIAKAEIVATTDADVILTPFWLEKIYERFEKDKNFILLFGPGYPITKNKIVRFFAGLLRIINQVLAIFHIAYLAAGSNTAFQKKYFLEAGGYSALPIMDDVEITSRMRKLGKILFDNRIFIYTSIRRIEKWGAFRTGYIYAPNYFKLVLLVYLFYPMYRDIKKYLSKIER